MYAGKDIIVILVYGPYLGMAHCLETDGDHGEPFKLPFIDSCSEIVCL